MKSEKKSQGPVHDYGPMIQMGLCGSREMFPIMKKWQIKGLGDKGPYLIIYYLHR